MIWNDVTTCFPIKLDNSPSYQSSMKSYQMFGSIVTKLTKFLDQKLQQTFEIGLLGAIRTLNKIVSSWLTPPSGTVYFIWNMSTGEVLV